MRKNFCLTSLVLNYHMQRKFWTNPKKMLHDADILVESAEKHLKDVFCADETH